MEVEPGARPLVWEVSQHPRREFPKLFRRPLRPMSELECPREPRKSKAAKTVTVELEHGEELVSCAYSTCTQRNEIRPGVHGSKPNQDRVQVVRAPGSLLLCVADGHGKFGHLVSEWVAQTIGGLAGQALSPDLLSEALCELDSQMVASGPDQVTLSGSTCCCVVLRPDMLFCVNVGDSRAVVGVVEDGQVRAEAISRDHTPSLASEYRRITSEFGPESISTLKDPAGNSVGPLRVWVGEGNRQGLAMTRSIGDTAGKQQGITATPELIARPLLGVQVVIVASDGVWDVLSNQEAAEIALRAKHAAAAASALKRMASKKWVQTEGSALDDITVAVAFVGGLC